jgi:acetylornithine deacetylase/succinyl-diaminopimelate desuccinylase-like protein
MPPPTPPTNLRAALRRRSRIALYASLCLTLAATIFGVQGLNRASAPPTLRYRWAEEDLSRDPRLQLLSRYVQIDTAQPAANERAGAEFLAAELRSAGLEPVIEDLGERRANVWAILEGESPRAVVLHNHIDTDPLGDPATWEFGPLSGAIDGPAIWGRGTFDMKSVAVAQLEAIKAIARSGRRPQRSVIFLGTGSEEIGSEWGMRRILELHPELASRFDVLLTEGGVVETLETDRLKYWGTEVAQRRRVVVTYEGAAADLERLRQQLLQSPRKSGPFLTPEVREFLAAYAPTRDARYLRELLSAPDELLADPARMAQLPPLVRALFFHEVFPGHVDLETDPQRPRMRVVFLLLPRAEFRPVLDEILPESSSVGLSRSFEESEPPMAGSPTSDPTYRAIQRVLGVHHPGVTIGPWVLTRSFSDARFVRAQGIPAFGFSPFAIVTSDTLSVGAANEHIGTEAFLDGVEVYRELLADLVFQQTEGR